jgi:hypothetical protein
MHRLVAGAPVPCRTKLCIGTGFARPLLTAYGHVPTRWCPCGTFCSCRPACVWLQQCQLFWYSAVAWLQPVAKQCALNHTTGGGRHASQQQVQSGAMLLEHTARLGCSGVWEVQGSVCQHTQQEPVLPHQDSAAMHPCKHTQLLRADPFGQHDRCAGALQLLCAATGLSACCTATCNGMWEAPVAVQPSRVL